MYVSRKITNQARAAVSAMARASRALFGSTRTPPADRPAHFDVLEGLDLLRHTVLEHLEVRRGQIANRDAFDSRIRVDADEVRLGAETALRVGRRRRLWRRGFSPAPSRRRRWCLSPARVNRDAGRGQQERNSSCDAKEAPHAGAGK